MKKYAVLVAICLVGLMATMTFAKAVNVALSPTADAPEDARGRLILNCAKGADKTEVQLNVWGLDPESKYTAWIHVDLGSDYQVIAGWSNIGTFGVNASGNGSLHASLPGDVSEIEVFVNFETPSTTWVLTP